MNREEICLTALEYLNTPFHHQGRLKGVGVDCAGLIVEIAKECNLYKNKVEDLMGYSKIPDGISLYNTLLKGTEKEKSLKDLEIGDIILFRFLNNPQHLGIYMPDNKIIHSYSVAGKVVLHEFDNKWKKRVVSIFQFYNIKE